LPSGWVIAVSNLPKDKFTDLSTGWTAVVASEAGFFVVLVNLWSQGSVPEGALCECKEAHAWEVLTTC
jgi:hypothetical protein